MPKASGGCPPMRETLTNQNRLTKTTTTLNPAKEERKREGDHAPSAKRTAEGSSKDPRSKLDAWARPPTLLLLDLLPDHCPERDLSQRESCVPTLLEDRQDHPT